MSIRFESLTPYDELDKPIQSLKDGRFDEVKLICFDEVITFTTDKAKAQDLHYLGKKCVCASEILISLYSEHLVWYEHGIMNILPYSSINRWVLD